MLPPVFQWLKASTDVKNIVGMKNPDAPDITVNAVCPGLVATDMWKRMDRDLARIENGQEGEAFARRVSAVPMGRAQSPDDVAGVVLFLASQAADYMTGQSVNVDGGLVLN